MESNQQAALPILGKKIQYTVNATSYKEGKVLDRIQMFDMRKESEHSTERKNFIVTGYLVENSETKELENVAAWRLKKLLN